MLSGYVDGDFSTHVSAHLLGLAMDDDVPLPTVHVDPAAAVITVTWPDSPTPAVIDMARLLRDLAEEE
jgi:hypothetical protein